MERQDNLERLLNTVEKLGFSEQVKEQVKEHMDQGLGQFQAYESLRMGENKIDYQLNFDLSKTANDGTVYLNTIDALLDKAIQVPHTVVLGVDTREVEALLKNKPLPDNVHPGNLNEFEMALYEHQVKVQTNLEFLQHHAPQVFNALFAKYNPEVSLVINPEMQAEQATLQQGLSRYNSYSTYFNLTALEMYNLLDGGAALKTLFKTKGDKDPAVPQQDTPQMDNKYKSWVQLNLDTRRPDGSLEIKLYHENRQFDLRKVLGDFNFSETNDRYSRADVMRFMEKGSQVKVTNLNTTGEKELLIRANPEYKSIDLFKVNGVAIGSPKSYLKNALKAEVGAFVEFKKMTEDTHPKAQQEALTPATTSEKAHRFEQSRNRVAGIGKGMAAEQGKAEELTDKVAEQPPVKSKRKPREMLDENPAKQKMAR